MSRGIPKPVSLRATPGLLHGAPALLLVLLAVLPSWTCAQGLAQNLEFHPPASAADPNTPQVMRDLAQRLIPVYAEPDRQRYLANLSALQLTAGDYAAAYAARLSLRELRHVSRQAGSPDRALIFDLYAAARAVQVESRVPFAQAFTQAFRNTIWPLSDLDAYIVTGWLSTPLSVFQDGLQRLFDQYRSHEMITQSQALDLIWTYLTYDAYRNFAPQIEALTAEDDARRYVTDDLLVQTSDHASLSVLVVRPKNAPKPVPSLLEFTIYVYPQNDARECAAHGYAGVVAYTRGKRKSPDTPVPYEHDGEDARTVINWITGQSWSDGRVAMYGEGYSGFTAWAAAKRPPPGLKAIVADGSTAPGIDTPMAGNIFLNSAYRWLTYVTRTKGLDEDGNRDEAHWRSTNEQWYTGGKPYRDFDRIAAGSHNPIFQRWLHHPAYDTYWRKMVPYENEFAQINIPVLAFTGYYDSAEPAALYYFTQHFNFNPRADHTLVIGPYDHAATARGPVSAVAGYTLDSLAAIDPHELRYQWLDSIFRGSPRPALLKDRINYEVMGANEWGHVANIGAMANGTLRFYLDPGGTDESHKLATTQPGPKAFVLQKVNLADRSDATWTPPTTVFNRTLALHDSVVFVSDPVTQPTTVSGTLSGQLDLTLNKQDVDLEITLFEQLPGGEYLALYNPPFSCRASYADDREERQLLNPAQRQHLPISGEQLMGRRLQSGSRLVLVVSVVKRPDRQINYGTGRDVSDESIADARVPLQIRWYGSSYVEVPVWR
jgi:putative CocE/NonD family hydrolase